MTFDSKFYKNPLKDKNNNSVFPTNEVQIMTDSALLEKDVEVCADFGYYKKGEYISKGERVTDILQTLFKDPSTRQNKFTSLQKTKDFVYEIEYDNYDWDYGEKYIRASKGLVPGGGCSCFRVGKYHVRMYDWYYNNEPTFPIRSTGGKYKTIGTAVFHGMKTSEVDSVISDNTYNFRFDVLPLLTVDGINECGVCVNANVTSADYGLTYNSNPNITNPAKKISVSSVVRYVLDNCKTAKEAVQTIEKELNIFGVDFHGYEYHYMISDINDTFIVEFVNGKAVIIPTDQKHPPIMTNFHVFGTSLNYSQLDLNTVTPLGAGVERYNIILNNMRSVVDSDTAYTVMQKIKYTTAYDISDWDKAWYSEFVGDYGEMGKLTNRMSRDKFKPAMEIANGLFNNRSRDVENTWQTVHACIYDLEEKTFRLFTQEFSEGNNPTIYTID